MKRRRPVPQWRSVIAESDASSHDDDEPWPVGQESSDPPESTGRESDDSASCVGQAMPELARWCRTQLRCDGPVAAGIRSIVMSGDQTPARLLVSLGAEVHGRQFLQQCVSRYEGQLATAIGAHERARLLASLASLSEAIGQLGQALEYTCSALAALGVHIDPLPELCEAVLDGGLPRTPPFLCAAIRRALGSRRATSDPMPAALLSELVRLRRQQCAMRARASCLRRMPTLPLGSVTAVAREKSSELSAERFRLEYSTARRPVVIEMSGGVGRCGMGPKEPWTLNALRQRIGRHAAALKRRVRGSSEWAGLEPLTEEAGDDDC